MQLAIQNETESAGGAADDSPGREPGVAYKETPEPWRGDTLGTTMAEPIGFMCPVFSSYFAFAKCAAPPELCVSASPFPKAYALGYHLPRLRRFLLSSLPEVVIIPTSANTLYAFGMEMLHDSICHLSNQFVADGTHRQCPQ